MNILDDHNKYETCRFNKNSTVQKGCKTCGGKVRLAKEMHCKKLNIVTSKFICAMCTEYEKRD